MAIIARAKSGGYNPVSEGVHMAVCVGVIDLGDQWSEQFGKTQRRVLLIWELPDETYQIDGTERLRTISKEYTLSLNQRATLRQHLEAWRGKKFSEQELGPDEETGGFDLKNILGKSCQIQVIHNEKGYANVSSIMAFPKGMQPIHASENLTYFDLSDPDGIKGLSELPGWVQDKIKESETYKKLTDTEFHEMPDDDLPF